MSHNSARVYLLGPETFNQWYFLKSMQAIVVIIHLAKLTWP